MHIRRVVGPSMKPTLDDGDIVLFSRRRAPKKSSIVLAKVHGRDMVKRVTKLNKTSVELRGDNRRSSTDSRTFGRVARRNIKGVLVLRITKRVQRPLAFGALAICLLLAISPTLWSMREDLADEVEVRSPAVPAAKPIVPKTYFDAASVRTNVEYCNGQLADIYYPNGSADKQAPVVLFIHGGAWRQDNKNAQPFQMSLLNGLKDRGVAIVSINYRLAPQHPFPAAVDDVRCAVRFVRANAQTYGFDGTKIGAMGFSAGGHLAAMLGTVDDDAPLFSREPYNGQSSRVSAVVSLAGIFDFSRALNPNNAYNIGVFLQGKPIEGAYPLAYVTPGDAPSLLVHGAYDIVVQPDQDVLFATKLKEAGVAAEYLVVENAAHSLESINGAPTNPTSSEVTVKIRDFFLAHL